MKNFLEFCKTFRDFKFAKQLGVEVKQRDKTMKPFTESFGRDPDAFIKDIEASLPKSKIFNVGKSLRTLLLLTKVPKKNDSLQILKQFSLANRANHVTLYYRIKLNK